MPSDRWLTPFGGGWRAVGWLACGIAGGIMIVWYVILGPGEMGRVVLRRGRSHRCHRGPLANVTIQGQTRRLVVEADERLRRELAAAEERSARELALNERLHRAEVEAQQQLHRSELQAHRELARVERVHLLKYLQKQAVIEVSRAVSAHTQMLATLWNQGANILRHEDRTSREKAMYPIFEQISQAVNDFSVELDNAYLLIEDVRLHHALDRVNEAVLMAIRIAEDIHVAVVEGREPESNPVPSAQQPA